MRTNRRTSLWVYPLATLAFAVGMCWVYLRDPVTYTKLIAEDHAGENFTAATLLLASALLAVSALMRGPRLGRLILALLAAIAMFGGMEEISWGQRLLHYDTPTIVRSINFQDEMTLHNIVDTDRAAPWVGVALLVWAAVAWLPARVQIRLRKAGLPRLGDAAWPWAVLTAALLIDRYAFVKSDELGEMSLGLMVLFFAIETTADQCRITRALRMRLLLMFIGVGLCASASVVMLHRHTPWMGYRYDTTAYSYAKLYRLPDQAMRIYDYIDHQPKLRTDTSAMRYARLLRDVGRHSDAERVLLREREVLNAQQAKGTAHLELLRRRIAVGRLLGDDAFVQSESLALEMAAEALLNDEAVSPEDHSRVRWVLAKVAADAGEMQRAEDLLKKAYSEAETSTLRRELWMWSIYTFGHAPAEKYSSTARE